MLGSFLLGRGAGTGWTIYPPLRRIVGHPSRRVDIVIFRLHLAGLSSIAGSINFLCTINNLKTRGLRWFNIPLFLIRV